MNQEQRRDESREDSKASGDASGHEVDAATNPGPRGNPEADAERVERDEEDRGRAGAN